MTLRSFIAVTLGKNIPPIFKTLSTDIVVDNVALGSVAWFVTFASAIRITLKSTIAQGSSALNALGSTVPKNKPVFLFTEMV